MAIASAIGGVIGAAGSVMQGVAAKQEANYQAQIARNNAVIAAKNAQAAQVAGDREGEAYRIKAAVAQSSIRAKASASGIDVNVGSPLRVQVGAKRIEELDALTIRNNSWREAHDFKTQAANFRTQGHVLEMSGRNAMTAGLIAGAAGVASAIGTAAGSPSSVSPKWDSWRSPTPYTPVSYGPAAATTSIAVPVAGSPSARYV